MQDDFETKIAISKMRSDFDEYLEKLKSVSNELLDNEILAPDISHHLQATVMCVEINADIPAMAEKSRRMKKAIDEALSNGDMGSVIKVITDAMVESFDKEIPQKDLPTNIEDLKKDLPPDIQQMF